MEGLEIIPQNPAHKDGAKPEKWPYHNGQVMYRQEKYKMWEQWLGSNYLDIVEKYGALEEVYQVCEMLYVKNKQPEVSWLGGGSRGCTLDLELEVPSLSKDDKKYNITCKMDKVVKGGEETDVLFFDSIEYSNGEIRWKNVTRLPGPSHTELAAKIFLHHFQRQIIDEAYNESYINRHFKIEEVFPKDSLQKTLDDQFISIYPIYEGMMEREKKTYALLKQGALYAVVDAFRREDEEAISQFMKLARTK